MNVPGFLARQFYVAGSLRNTPTGFALDAQNPLGDGILVGVGRLAVDGVEIAKSAVSAQRVGDDKVYAAADVSIDNPIRIAKGDRITLTVDGRRLKVGEHLLEVELVEINLGALRLALRDKLAAATIAP